MAIEVVSDKIQLKVSGKRLWKAVFENAKSVLPKASPEVIEKVVDEGEGFVPGATRTIHFHKSYTEQKAKEKNVEHVILFTKEKVLEVDHHALSLKVETIEGGFLGVLVKFYTTYIRIEETGPDSCILHWTFEYEALPSDHKAHIPHIFKESMTRGLSSAEAFLLSHHDY